MSRSLYATSFSLKTLDHLGINLYGNVPAVIAELIANAHDAAARRVDITISPGQIAVQDDGIGMSLDDINTKYLRFGYEKRREVTTIQITDGERSIERHVMGRKGIGKISALSVAREVEVQTVQGNERNGFIISLDTIEHLQETNSIEYLPTPIPNDRISIVRGTRIELRQLSEHVTGLDTTLRASIARMFPNVGPEVLFDIYINGSPITIADRIWFDKVQFMWYFGDSSEKFIHYCPDLEKHFCVSDVVNNERGYSVSGWLATTFSTSDISVEQRIVPIYAQNKMIQRDILYDYKNYKVSSSYIIGEVYAPFMDVDTEPDIVLSDRQRINPNDPRYILLRQHVVDQVVVIDREWDKLRKQSPRHRPRKRRGSESAPTQANADNRTAPGPDPSTATEEESQPAPGTAPAASEGSTGNSGQDSATESASSQATSTPAASAAPQSPPRVSEAPPRNPTGVGYMMMEELIRQSNIEPSFQDRIRADLRESRLCYDNSAFKACVVMLGAALEGTMLGILRQSAAVDRIATTTFTNNVENVIRPAIGVPQQRTRIVRATLAQQMGELTFDMMRILVESLVPDLGALRVDHIQNFRNAIHPWRTITQPAIYGRIDLTRATQYVMSCHTIIEHLTRWNP